MTSVVFLHAHPDDEAIFTAITMHRLHEQGVRVVLATATAGEEGVPLGQLRPGESVGSRRLTELEAACTVLGVDRVLLLGRRDSGMIGAAANRRRNAFARIDVARETSRLQRLLGSESVDAVVSYDDTGIYGHPDHVAAHHLGGSLARSLGASFYESTVDREYLHFVPTHVVEGEGPRVGRPTVGRSSVEISLAIRASEAELRVKAAAMAAHDSQIPSASIGGYGFAETYGTEWYTRAAGAPVLELLGNEHVLAVTSSA